MNKFHPRNSAIDAVNRLFFFVLIVVAVLCFALTKISSVKKNYTELHRRVTALEMKGR